jgi:hypothetical protein
MQKDFYLNERSLAGYFEKDWFDHVLRTKQNDSSSFTFAPFDPSLLYCSYHEKFVNLLKQQLDLLGFQPKSVLEIGSSLGRTYFELCQSLPSLQKAVLVEPSQRLSSSFIRLFQQGSDFERFDVLNGNSELKSMWLDTRPLKSAAARVKVELKQEPFQSLSGQTLGQSDLVLCSNVIDQCQQPLELVELLKSCTVENGVLALSCTYQWQDKYIGAGTRQIPNIKELFNGDWQLLNEANLPFQFRVYERYWMTFLSHVCIWRRLRSSSAKEVI